MAENIDDPTLKTIATWRNHAIILATASEYKSRGIIFFNFVYKEHVLTEIKNASKAIGESDIPFKLLRQVRISLQKQFFHFNRSLKNDSKDMFIGLSFFNETLF